MSLKRFNADVRATRRQLDNPGIPGVITIERGDSEGEAIITFFHERLDDVFSVRLLAQNLDAYPGNSNFLLFTDADDISPIIASALEGLQQSTLGLSLIQCVHEVAATLSSALSSVDRSKDTTMTAPADNEPDDDDEDSDWELSDGDDEIFGLPSARPAVSKDKKHVVADPVSLEKLKKDLRTARQSGYRVGVLKGLDSHSMIHVVSLSMRIGKLGLSSETLEAWDIEPSNYIVLLMEIDGQYQSADTISSIAPRARCRFRFGTCDKYKPSLQAASDAFKPDVRLDSNTQSKVKDELEAEVTSFARLFISNSLERFMNEDFINLVKLRLKGSKSWDEANLGLQDMAQVQSTAPSGEAISALDKIKAVAGKKTNKGNRKSASDIYTDIRGDAFSMAPNEISLPLAAMQFAIHYFTRCTDYCLRCHQKLPKDFEALKPFVCSSPLCLFQYMTMGLGPSLEHEILTQPYVVDLLVSLCYSSVLSLTGKSGYPIREFPVGLRLKVPRLPIGTVVGGPPPPPLPPKYDQFGKIVDSESKAIKLEGDIDAYYLALTDSEDLSYLVPGCGAVLQQHFEGPAGPAIGVPPLIHHVLIKEVDTSRQSVTFDFTHRAAAPAVSQPFHKVMCLFPYNVDFDDLNDHEKAQAIFILLNSLPPVVDLRKYLSEHPNASLTSYDGMSASARTLLQWIVASNRSCILQVSPVQYHPGDLFAIQNTKARPQEEIPDLDSGFVQFRFAQGSPDKELRFHRALNDLASQKATNHPTIFAWHGSSLGNWHSILRQGLDHSQIHNGRAFGNGVYFSNNYAVSEGYSTQAAISWPSSALKPAKVVALCEILNSPEAFISTRPHYVVPNVDWIQCRYLFVQQRTEYGKPKPQSVQKEDTQMEEVAQDPKYVVYGPNGNPLRIPTKALPSGRNPKQQSKNSNLPAKRHSSVMVTDEEDDADLEAITSDLGSVPSMPKQQRISEESPVMEPSVQQPLGASTTDFKPGSLDLRSITRLALPQWADSYSSKRLAADIKQLQKVQTTTPLQDLGWYIHLDNIENMYQWIVELHSFDPDIPLTKDMKQAGVSSVVLEVRFGRDYPFSPPFIRVIRPRFLPFMSGGGK